MKQVKYGKNKDHVPLAKPKAREASQQVLPGGPNSREREKDRGQERSHPEKAPILWKFCVDLQRDFPSAGIHLYLPIK